MRATTALPSLALAAALSLSPQHQAHACGVVAFSGLGTMTTHHSVGVTTVRDGERETRFRAARVGKTTRFFRVPRWDAKPSGPSAMTIKGTAIYIGNRHVGSVTSSALRLGDKLYTVERDQVSVRARDASGAIVSSARGESLAMVDGARGSCGAGRVLHRLALDVALRTGELPPRPR